MTNQPTTTVPPLISGGVMLTYRCTNACRHCLYRCSPKPTDGVDFMSEDLIDRTFEALGRESSLHGVHIAGGEATLNWDRLIYAVRAAVRHGVSLDYLETNASWCEDKATARDGFRRLRAAGLNGVLISASLFHLEFTPLRNTNAAIDAAIEVFGRGGLLIWTEDVLRLMNHGLDQDRTYPIHQSCRMLGLEPEQGDIWRAHNYLRPGGRAAERLQSGLRPVPAETFAGDACDSVLRNTTHFHIDPSGNLYTGHCPGISVATIDDFHPRLNRETSPIHDTLAHEGPMGLLDRFAPDFVPDESGYVSKCHLCLEVRKRLFDTGQFAELRSAAFYAG